MSYYHLLFWRFVVLCSQHSTKSSGLEMHGTSPRSPHLLPRVLSKPLCYIERALQIGSGLLIKLCILTVVLGNPRLNNRYGIRVGRVLCVKSLLLAFAYGTSHSSWWLLAPLILNRLQVITKMWIITNIADPQPNLHQLMTFCCHYILVSATSHSQV